MKLEVLQENLIKGLSIASRLVSSKAQLPILNNILLTTDQARLKLSATNLETSINYWLGAKIIEKGTISIPAKVVTEFVASLPAEKVQLESKANNLKVLCNEFEAEFVGLAASEFPAIPVLDKKTKLNLTGLIEAVPQVAFAAAQDESRPVLAGVYLKVLDEGLVMAATDGYRLSKKIIKVDGTIKTVKEFKKGLIIPGWGLSEVARIVSEKEEIRPVGLNISAESNQIIFVVSEAEIVSRLIEGDFPDFEKIIPEEAKTNLTVDKETLLRAVRMASIFARQSANIVKFQIKKNKLKISANTAQVGSSVSEIEAQTEGEAGRIAFNSRYLIEFLNNINEEKIYFGMNDALSPGIFKPVKDKSLLHIIMPVRVQE